MPEHCLLLHMRTKTTPLCLQAMSRAKPLSLLPLIALIFYDVSGGPFGIEVRAAAGRGHACQ